MKSKSIFLILSLLVVFSMLLTACAAPAAEAPQPAEEKPAEAPPPAEEAPAEEPAPAEEAPAEEPQMELMSVAAKDCEYGGIIKEIKALDPLTVEFSMCVPDPAFLSKIAFSAFSIRPKEQLEATGGGGEELLSKPIGTGPYKMDEWKRGDSITYSRYDDYWGEKAITKTLVFRWSTEASARLLELQSGTVDGIDNPNPEDFETIKGDSNLAFMPREALNVFYIGFTNTFKPFDDVKVRKAVALAIDRQRIVENFYPAGSEVADYFTPCSIVNGCTGDKWWDFDVEGAKALLKEAGLEGGFKTKIFLRDVVRGYLPRPTDVATDIQAQLKANLNIDAQIEVMESGAFLDAADSGKLEGIHLLGWSADYPHITNFLDFHFNRNKLQFGQIDPSVYEELEKGSQTADTEKAKEFYIKANNALKETVPMIPVVHGGSAVAYLANVKGGYASPLTEERFWTMDPGGKDTFVWMQSAEPISLYCPDETDGESLRACEQTLESLYAYEPGGTASVPSLATVCEPNADLTVWTCKLRENVKFHDGSALDANDVVASFAAGIDAANPWHKGNTGAFEYWFTLWGNIMNVPPAAE